MTSVPLLRRAPAAGLLVGILALAGCRDDATGPEARRVAGVDFGELFAPPSDAEVTAILDGWSSRTPRAEGVREEAVIPVTLAGSPGTLRVISHLVDGSRHVGGVLAPDDAPPASLPVLVYAHGSEDGTGEAEVRTIALAMGDLADDVVLVAPAFRSEPFRFQGEVLVAEGRTSPWDRDVDDALSLVRVAPEVVPAADTTRVGVLGFSRGAGVALLMSVRDPVIDRVVAFFGPTDFMSPWAQEVAEEALLGMRRDLPGLAFLDRELLQPLKAGVLAVDDVRPELIRRSAVLFAERLPPLQVHHGTADQVVSVEQARRLTDAVDALGGAAPEFQAFLYEGGGHDPFSLPGALTRAGEFLTPILEAGSGRRAGGRR